MNVAAKSHDFQVRAHVQDKRLSPKRCGADNASGWQFGKGFGLVADKSIARVFAFQHTRKDDALRQPGRYVLHGMNSQVDAAIKHGVVYFPGEQALAANFGQRPIQDHVAGRLDNDDFGSICHFRKAGNQQGFNFFSLGQRQRAATGADTKGFYGSHEGAQSYGRKTHQRVKSLTLLINETV